MENKGKAMDKQGKWWKTIENARKIKENLQKTQGKASQKEKQQKSKK